MFGSLRSIIEEQYVLSKKCNISISESNDLPDFEREIFINLLMKDLKEEREALEKR